MIFHRRRLLFSADLQVRYFSIVILLFVVASPLCFGQNSQLEPTPRPLEADEVARLEPTKLKELMLEVQDLLEVNPKLDGVLVVEMRIGPANDHRERPVLLEGRVRDTQQKALVSDLATHVMQSISFWSTSDDEFIVNSDKLNVVIPSAQEESKHLNKGIELFLSGQFLQADAFFTKALVESQNREPIHYWKVANAIALHQPDRAERRLAVILRSNPKGSDVYAAKLQRLQGQYRRALSELEQKVMLKSRLGIDVQSK